MADTLTSLKTKLKESFEAVTELKMFLFDDVSQINADSQNEYPFLLVKPPISTFDSKLDYQVFQMDMFVFDIELTSDEEIWTVKWNDCQNYLIAVIKDILADHPNYILVGDNINVSYGHYQHNDKLIGARAQFNLRAFYGC